MAPSLVGSRGFYSKVLLAAFVISTAPMFDMLCAEVSTPAHVVGCVATIVLLVSLTIPFYLFVYQSVARLVIELSERRGWPAPLAYSIGVVLNNVALAGFIAAFLLAGPTQVFDPDYRLPQDGAHDVIARKTLQSNVATIITGVGVLAIAAVFKV